MCNPQNDPHCEELVTARPAFRLRTLQDLEGSRFWVYDLGIYVVISILKGSQYRPRHAAIQSLF